MARNRKRAKERRSRRPAGQTSRPGVATTREPREVDSPSPLEPREADGSSPLEPRDADGPSPLEPRDADSPRSLEPSEDSGPFEAVESPNNPLEHAAPDVELADAQLALGRPGLARDGAGAGEPEPEPDDFDEEEEFEHEVDESIAAADGSNGDGGRGLELAAPSGEAPARRLPGAGNRLINFLRGSWRELQRVQWPDRRQVVQATGVVIGFVIVAGLYLGLADTLSTKIVNFLLK